MKQLQYATGIKFSIKNVRSFTKDSLCRAMYQNFVFFPTQYLVSFFTTFFFCAMRRKNKFIQLFGALEAAQVELTCWICSITQVICVIFFANCAFLITNMILAKEIFRNVDKCRRKSFGRSTCVLYVPAIENFITNSIVFQSNFNWKKKYFCGIHSSLLKFGGLIWHFK